jgi:hypothetical protein
VCRYVVRGFDDLNSGRCARRLRIAKLGDEQLGCRIGPRVELALEQRNKIPIVLERFGLASRSDQRLYDQPMCVLAQIVDRQRTMRRFKHFIRVTRS